MNKVVFIKFSKRLCFFNIPFMFLCACFAYDRGQTTLVIGDVILMFLNIFMFLTWGKK